MDADIKTATDAVAEADAAFARLSAVRAAIARVIFGQETAVEAALVTLLSGGHGLIVGVPGLAKTKLVETLAVVLGLSERRIQFTPDLMPSDILGSEVLDQAGRRQPLLPLHPWSGVRPTRHGRRDQPRLIHAPSRRSCRPCRSIMSPSPGVRYDLPAPFHVLANAEPAGARGYLSAARSPARPLPARGSTSTIPTAKPSAAS